MRDQSLRETCGTDSCAMLNAAMVPKHSRIKWKARRSIDAVLTRNR
jgi:hypothetical protein